MNTRQFVLSICQETVLGLSQVEHIPLHHMQLVTITLHLGLFSLFSINLHNLCRTCSFTYKHQIVNFLAKNTTVSLQHNLMLCKVFIYASSLRLFPEHTVTSMFFSHHITNFISPQPLCPLQSLISILPYLHLTAPFLKFLLIEQRTKARFH